jgi:hypothetical protein
MLEIQILALDRHKNMAGLNVFVIKLLRAFQQVDDFLHDILWN